MSKENTPTPEMDAFERDIIAFIPEELHQLQAYARRGRELETRLTAASEAIERLTAEIDRMKAPIGGDLARQFHETYERLAPSFGYETRKETRVFDPDSANGKLMVSVIREVLGTRAPITRYRLGLRNTSGNGHADAPTLEPDVNGSIVLYADLLHTAPAPDAVVEALPEAEPVTDGLQDAIDFLKANRYRKGFETAATMLDGLLSARERLRAAEAELAAMRSGEVVAWATPDLWRVLSEAHRKREVEVGSTVFVGQFTIPLYRSPAPDAVVEALPKGCPETLWFSEHGFFDNRSDHLSDDDGLISIQTKVEIHPVGTRARLAALTRQAKRGE